MNILFLCSSNSGSLSPFVQEQIRALEQTGHVSASLYLVEGKGITGYLKNWRKLRRYIRKHKPDLIHAHYGLCGSLAVLQRTVPVVVTYHGSDINLRKSRLFSKPGLLLAAKRIFVSEKLLQKSKYSGVVIPCGIDPDVFYPTDKAEARTRMGLSQEKKYILFSSSFGNPIKNSSLAKEAIALLKGNCELIELKGYSREEVALLYNAADVALLTSFSEGSPQFVKEALACNCPVVSTDVGDVKQMLDQVEGCYVTSFQAEDIHLKIEQCLQKIERVNSRGLALQYSNQRIAEKLQNIYHEILHT